jgi:hypothetical protein
MLRLAPAAAALLTLAACGKPAPAEPTTAEQTPPAEVAAPVPWLVRVKIPTAVRAPDPLTGCLTEGATRFEAGTELEVLARSADFILINDAGGIVPAADVEEVSKPETFPRAERLGVIATVGNTTPSATYGSDGCVVEGEPLKDGTSIEALARSFDSNFRGWVVIDRALTLAPVRQVEVPGWVYPWHSGVQLITPLEKGGFVIGAAVLIGPHAMLTARHMGADEKTCYGRVMASGPSWYGGEFTCGNVAGPATPAPLGVDAAIIPLLRREPGPYAKLRGTPVTLGEEFFSSRWGKLSRNIFSDGKVLALGNANALCEDWPMNTSFGGPEFLQGGDSGGPAWIGDELVGIAHGGECYGGFDPNPHRHVFVHVPGILGFLVPELPRDE